MDDFRLHLCTQNDWKQDFNLMQTLKFICHAYFRFYSHIFCNNFIKRHYEPSNACIRMPVWNRFEFSREAATVQVCKNLENKSSSQSSWTKTQCVLTVRNILSDIIIIMKSSIRHIIQADIRNIRMRKYVKSKRCSVFLNPYHLYDKGCRCHWANDLSKTKSEVLWSKD